MELLGFPTWAGSILGLNKNMTERRSSELCRAALSHSGKRNLNSNLHLLLSNWTLFFLPLFRYDFWTKRKTDKARKAVLQFVTSGLYARQLKEKNPDKRRQSMSSTSTSACPAEEAWGRTQDKSGSGFRLSEDLGVGAKKQQSWIHSFLHSLRESAKASSENGVSVSKKNWLFPMIFK